MYKGTFTAIVTPFRDDQSIDEDALRAHVEFQIKSGIDGLVPVGTTGEYPTLTHDEVKRVIRIVVEETKKRVPVIPGTGSYSTAATVQNTAEAREMGADGALVVCPYYNKPTQKGLLLHYGTIVEKTRFPVIIYNIKGRTGVNMTTDTLMELAKSPYIEGVKEASGDINQIREVIARAPKEFSVLSGDDGITLDLIKSGGHGVISVASNIIPERLSEFTRTALAGNWGQSDPEQVALTDLFENLFIETNPIPVKTALAMMNRCREIFRLPLCTMADKNREKLGQVLRNYDLIG